MRLNLQTQSAGRAALPALSKRQAETRLQTLLQRLDCNVGGWHVRGQFQASVVAKGEVLGSELDALWWRYDSKAPRAERRNALPTGAGRQRKQQARGYQKLGQSRRWTEVSHV